MFHVKHLPSQPIEPDAVTASLGRIGITVSPLQAGMLAAHANLVLEANEQLNLTRITEPRAVLALHIVDSLAFLPLAGPLTGRIVDIGSGAGFPGIPLAILGYDVVLCESVRKKAAFLESTVEALELPIRVAPLRAEEMAASEPASAEVVIARAVSSLAALVELAAPLLRKGGRLLALKGSPAEAEIEEAQLAAGICGLEAAAGCSYELPTGEARSLFIYTKIAQPRLKLPRRPGMAQRHPLVCDLRRDKP